MKLLYVYPTLNLLYVYPTLNKNIILSLRCSWSIAYRRCSNYIFILDLAQMQDQKHLSFGILVRLTL